MKQEDGTYLVALDEYGSYERAVTAFDLIDAVEEWAQWYCIHNAEFASPLDCVAKVHGDKSWTQMQVDIEAVPVFHATLKTHKGTGK